MNENPYQSPSEASAAAPNLLLLPSIGCIVLGVLATLPSLAHLALAILIFQLQYRTSDATEHAWQSLTMGLCGLTFAIAAYLMAWLMLKRRNKWLIILGAILGTSLILPAPVTALILLRMRRKEVWESFNPSLPAAK